MIEFISALYTENIQAVLYVVIAVGMYFVIKKPLYAFYIAVFTLPFRSFYVLIGTNFEVWKIISILSLALFGPSLMIKSYRNVKSGRYFHLITLIILYSLVVTVLFFFIFAVKDEQVVSGGYWKNEARPLVQFIFLLTTFNLALWPVYVAKNKIEIFRVLKIIVYSNVVLALFGIIQLLSMKLLNFNPFPINRGEFFDYESGNIIVQGADTISRINSIAGEPKHFAISLVFGILIVVLYRLNGRKIIKYDLPALAAFLVCLVATFSTTGFIWMGVAALQIIYFYRHKMSKLTVMAALILVVGINAFSVTTDRNPAPYIERTLSKAGLEVQDDAIFRCLIDNPLNFFTGFGLGNIHIYATDYLPPNYPVFRGFAFKANTGFLFLSGDVGLFGITLYILLVYGLVRSLGKMHDLWKGEEVELRIMGHFASITFVLFMMRYNEYLFIAIGLMLYLHTQFRYEKRAVARASMVR